MEKTVTFVIQGPLTIDGFRAIKNNSMMGPVIVSCWPTDSIQLIEQARALGARVLINQPINRNRYNFQNIRSHINSSLKGILNSNTNFIVKVRSDEYFTDLRKIVSAVYLRPDKIAVSNFFFRKTVLFHPSDHIMAGTKHFLREMFEESLDFIDNKIDEKYNDSTRVPVREIGLKKDYTFKYVTAEMTFCLSYLKTKGIDVVKDISGMTEEEIRSYHKRVMKENYSLIRASELGNFLFRFKSNPDYLGPTAFTKEEEFLNYKIKSITSLDEL